MNTRTLKNGTTVEELATAKTLTVKTKCPSKWLLVDMETLETYVGHVTDGKNDWEKVDPKILNELV